MSSDVTIVIPIYTGVTQLDFTGPHQVFSRLPGARVVVASLNAAPITVDGLTFAGTHDLEAIERCDVLCVPGGMGCTGAMEDPRFMAAIVRLGASARTVASVCTGSLILAAAGLLAGRRAACHWAWRDMLALFGAVPDPARVVVDGTVITGGGVTAGIDFAFTLVAEIAGRAQAEAIQLALEYAPQPPFDAGRPETAPPAVREAAEARLAPLMETRRAQVARIAAQVARAG